MPTKLFSDDALRAQVQKLETLPADQAGAGVVAKDGDVGIVAAGNVDVGKGWSVAGSLAWMKDAGKSAAIWVGWKKPEQ